MQGTTAVAGTCTTVPFCAVVGLRGEILADDDRQVDWCFNDPGTLDRPGTEHLLDFSRGVARLVILTVHQDPRPLVGEPVRVAGQQRSEPSLLELHRDTRPDAGNPVAVEDP